MNSRKRSERCSYPSVEIEYAVQNDEISSHILITAVEEDSPAYVAGFEPGCFLTSLDGFPIKDILDWRWRSDTDVITVGYIDNDGDQGTVVLTRYDDRPWGFQFEGIIFDQVYECCNACTFCFMRQLPPGMRPSLTLRDDDYRLSFLSGTFVTLTNLSVGDERRIIDQRISPLHVSLQASEPAVRQVLMGKHEARGFEALEHLLQAGIECYCQIVLVPGVNDDKHLKCTLEWAYEQPGILGVGIVPLGYTRHQTLFTSGFEDPSCALAVLELLEPFQQKAQEQRGNPWVYAADEFYLVAYGKQVFSLLPPAAFYGSFDMFEDGIGMVRSTLDDWQQAHVEGLVESCGNALARSKTTVYMVSGFAQQAYLTILMRDPQLHGRLMPLYVENRFFGGNVDVTGLLTGEDIVRTLQAIQPSLTVGNHLVVLPRVIFNDEGVTLDDMTLDNIAEQIDLSITVVSCSPLDYLKEIEEIVE